MPRSFWRDWGIFVIGETRFYSENGPEGPESLFLVIELNAIYFEARTVLGWDTQRPEGCVVTTVYEGPSVFNLCHVHMQIINCFFLWGREWIATVILLLFGY